MTYDFSHLKQKAEDIQNHLKEEFSGIRTGRATPALLDSVMVDSYGSKTPINQVAGINMEDARTLRIAPYDASQVTEVEKAITNSNLGVSVSVDANGLRIFFPELTEEVRESLNKLVKEKLEAARISLRGERDNTWNDIQKQEKDKEISEDEKFGLKEDMQKIIGEENAKMDAMSAKKEGEIAN
ncbi:ribosome recycling factor [bacterium]|jgi:ribosome recycling factor|nr:ribosome recycling factor [bacterium]MBT3730074.1 ribosome recycling factor [bacterium]MBT4894638.1 ribosome recycling factor [bacterium]